MSRTHLRIRLLGPLEVFAGEDRMSLPPSRKARALLAYLAATARPHARSALCDLFWQDVNDPRAGLRWALSKLRSAVGGDETEPFVSTRDRIQLDAEAVEVDLHRVHALLEGSPDSAATPALRRAAEAFRGEFVEGLDLPKCHQFEAWCLGQREGLRRLHLSVHATLAERLRETPEAALPHALERLTLDPYSEAAYIAAMGLLADLGRADKGLELYDRCRRMLTEHLGVSPSEELESVRRRLRSGPRLEGGGDQGPGEAEGGVDALRRVLAALGDPDHLRPPERGEPPLVGRGEAMDRLGRTVDGTEREGTGAAILISGEAGIGKTRLLRELVRKTRSSGGWVLSGPVFESEVVRPWGPWADMFRGLPEAALDSATRRGLAGLLEPPGAEPRNAGPSERIQLFDAAAHLLERMARARAPGVVVLDDVQWLDASSTSLLHYLIRTLTTVPVVFVLAVRDAEVEAGSPLGGMLRSLAGSPHLDQVHLRRLSATDTEALVRAVDGTVDPDPVFAASEGNPFFALALTASRREGGDPMPADLEEELQHRLERLEPGARALLPWAAAMGRDFDVRTLVRVVERPAAEVVDAIAHLERRGIVRASGADRFDFNHDLLRQAAYSRSSEPVRREIHRGIARTLETLDRDEARMQGAVAHHAELGGIPDLAARAYATAAERFLWVFAFDEAALMVERGLVQAKRLPDEKRVPLEMALLRVYSSRSMRDRRPVETEERVARVTQAARSLGRTNVVAIGHALAMELQYQRGAFREAKRSSLQYADAGRESGPETAVRALSETATCLLLLDQAPEDARRLAVEAEGLAETHGLRIDAVSLARALLSHHDGTLDVASAAFQEVIELGRQANDRWWECAAMTRMIMVALDRGDPGEAVDRSTRARELAKRMDDPEEAAFARGLGAVAAGRIDGARVDGPVKGGIPGPAADLEEALERLRDLDSLWKLAHVQAYAAEADLGRGRVDDAAARVRDVRKAARTLGRPGLLALARALEARCLAMAGDRGGAVARLESDDVVRPEHRLSHRAREAVARARRIVESQGAG